MSLYENYLDKEIDTLKAGSSVALPPFTLADSGKHLRVIGSDAFNPGVVFQATSLVTQTGGSLTLTFDGNTTAPINFDATEIGIKTAVEMLPNVGAGNVGLITGTFL